MVAGRRISGVPTAEQRQQWSGLRTAHLADTGRADQDDRAVGVRVRPVRDVSQAVEEAVLEPFRVRISAVDRQEIVDADGVAGELGHLEGVSALVADGRTTVRHLAGGAAAGFALLSGAAGLPAVRRRGAPHLAANGDHDEQEEKYHVNRKVERFEVLRRVGAVSEAAAAADSRGRPCARGGGGDRPRAAGAAP